MTPHGHADRLADPGGRAGNKRALSPQLTPIPEVAEPFQAPDADPSDETADTARRRAASSTASGGIFSS